MNGYFKKQIEALRQRHEALLQRPMKCRKKRTVSSAVMFIRY